MAVGSSKKFFDNYIMVIYNLPIMALPINGGGTMSKKSKWSLEGTVLTVVMPEGETAEFDLASVHADVITQVQAYGLKQKLSDSTARPSDQKLTEKEAIAEMQGTYDNLVSGIWREKGGGSGISMAKKVKEAALTATPEQLRVLKELGLVAESAVSAAKPVVKIRKKEEN